MLERTNYYWALIIMVVVVIVVDFPGLWTKIIFFKTMQEETLAFGRYSIKGAKGSDLQAQQSHALPCLTCTVGGATMGLGIRSLLCHIAGTGEAQDPPAHQHVVLPWPGTPVS